MLNTVNLHLSRTAWSVLGHERYEIPEVRPQAKNDTIVVSRHSAGVEVTGADGVYGARWNRGAGGRS